MRNAATGAVVGTILATLVAVLWACNGDMPQPVACRDIPPGGCPIEHGDPCGDPSCTAAYACDSTSGAWTFDRACPPHPDAGKDAGVDASDGASGRDVDVDVPGANGGPGCADLELPDCPLGVAASCAIDCCGCEDLFVCVDGGWSPWGFCGDGGITQR